MRLDEFTAGDIVAIEHDGQERLVKIGALLGPSTRVGSKKEKNVRMVLLHDVDRDTYRELPGVWCVGPEIEAELVDGISIRLIRTKEWSRRALPADHDGDGRDPLISGVLNRGGTW